MSDGLFIIEDDGTEQFYTYAELAELDDALRHSIRPIEGSKFCYEADAFLELPLAQTPFYIQSWLPKRGKAMIYAPAKAGKSTVTVQLARQLGIGEAFLGIPVEQARVLYIQSELSSPVLQQRMRSTGHRYPNVIIGTNFGFKLDTDDSRDLLMEILLAVKPNVLALDPLYKMMDGDENETHDMLQVVNNLDLMFDILDTDLSIWIVHHGGKDLSKGGRGSSVLEDWVDSSIELVKTSKQGEPLRIKLTPKLLRHAELPPEPIRAELVHGEFELIEVIKTLEGDIQTALQNGPPLSVADLVEVTQASRSGVNKILRKLTEEGKTQRIERGMYKWAN